MTSIHFRIEILGLIFVFSTLNSKRHHSKYVYYKFLHFTGFNLISEATALPAETRIDILQL